MLKVKEFVKNTDLGSSYTYTTVGGKVVVDNVTSESITLRYDDFKFTKNGGEYTIKVEFFIIRINHNNF